MMKATDADWLRWAPEFTPEEFRCKCGCRAALMEKEFMEGAHALRLELGDPLVVSSGYRCPKHNLATSSSGAEGPHTTGMAADFLVSHQRAYALTALAFKYGFTGVGWNQRGDRGGRFVHLDCISPSAGVPRPTVWTY